MTTIAADAQSPLSSHTFRYSVMILAAGEGTRLRPLTFERPKPLVPLGAETPLLRLLNQVRAWQRTTDLSEGKRRSPRPIVANAFHLASHLVEFAKQQTDLAISVESTLMGTAGGVHHARALLGPGPTLVWNADIVTALDLAALSATYEAARCFACLAVKPAAAGEGNVGLDAHGRIVRLRHKRFSDEVSGGYFMGVQVISSAAHAALPAHGCLVGDLYIPALERGLRLMAYRSEAPFTDLGTPAAYLRANLELLNAATPSLILQGADVQAQVTHSVIGRRARVLAAVENSVVWDDVTVREPLVNSIATPRGIVRVNG